MSTARLLSVAVAMALAIGPATANAASTRAEYIAQADPICAHELAGAKRTLGGVNGDLRKGRNEQAASKFARATKVFKKGVAGVAAIPPPSSDSVLIGQWVEMLRRQIPLANRATHALRHSSPRSIKRAINKLFRVSDQTQALVKDYGFSDCSFM